MILTIICTNCGKERQLRKNEVNKKRNFCSRDCFYSYRKEHPVDTKERRAERARIYYKKYGISKRVGETRTESA
jgi:hypothetical protein